MRSLLIGAALLALAVPAFADPAEPTPSEPAASPHQGLEPDGTPSVDTKVFDGVTIDEMEIIAKAAGLNYERAKDNAGNDILNTKLSDTLEYTIFLVDCAKGTKRCTTINLVSYTFAETAKVTWKSLNAWNLTAWGARGILNKDGSSAVVANLGLDGGVTATWLKNRIANFASSLTSFSYFVGSGDPTVNPTP